MSEPTPLEAIFFAALEKPAAERGSYLDEACRGDADLRRRVERMLTAQVEAASFLETPPSAIVREAVPTLDQASLEKPGTQIGPYKLLQQIGEGGMGVVYMAEQHEPVKRRVALKIIKPGMDTRQVIARFEAERQALSLMDHPNIAKVLDAGTTASGRPYFVMELVKGQPITQYCDEKHLTPRQRLELLLPVCQAIQHAHQKGIIHRDIKPTNILVAEYDQQPVPKVIDFGVAKATNQALTEKTMFTGLGQIVGTLEYMSPEQAKVNQLDIDTRSDIYSLGVLLYELLTGSTPFDKQRLRSAAFDEMLRIIREEEPPKPSTRLSDSHESLSSISAHRHTEPARLTRLLRGELDWIVMKCLEKDRSRRYETASGLAMDVQRYLDDEPVLACPPSAGYRLRKFVQRNKGPVIAAALVLLVLIGGIIGTSWGLVYAEQARWAETQAKKEAQEQAAIAQAVNDFINSDLLNQANPRVALLTYDEPVHELKLRTVLDRAAAKIEEKFKSQPLVAAELHHTVGNTYRRLGEKVLSEKHLRRAVELRRVHLGEEHVDTLKSMNFLAFYERDVEVLEKVLAARRRVLGEEHRDTLQSRLNLALVVREKGDNARAIALFRETLAAQQQVMGKDHMETAWTMTCLAHTLSMTIPASASSESQDVEIEQLFRHAVTVLQNVAGDTSYFTWNTEMRLGEFLSSRGRYDEAEAVFRDGYARLQAKPAVPPEWAASAAFALAFVLMQNPGREAEAEKHYRIALPVRRRVLGEGHQDTADTAFRLAEALGAQKKFDEAEAVLREAYTALAANRASQGARDYEPVMLGWIIDKYRDWGQLERAAEWELIRSAMKSGKKELETQSK